MHRFFVRSVAAALSLLAILPPDNARGGELDVVATTKVDVSKAFSKSFAPEAFAQMQSALSSLSPVDASDGKSKDGAARYRLAVEHKGIVTVGSKLTWRPSYPKTKEETVKTGNSTVIKIMPDKTHYLSTWYLPVKQTTTLTFTLQKWDDGAYKLFDTWTITTPAREAIGKDGLAPVAELVQDATKPNVKLVPDCPIALEQAREEGFVWGLPGDFGSAFAARWVKGKFDKVTPKGDSEVEYVISVENKSPWPLSRVYVESTDKDATLAGFVEFKPAIPAGKSGKGTGSRFVTAVPKKTLGMRVTEAQFDPQK